jgi:hypothetical protein
VPHATITSKEPPGCPACGHALRGGLTDHSDCKCRQCSRTFRVLLDRETGTIALAEPVPREQPVEPLGLPRGSVRAAVALLASGTAWALIGTGRELPEYLFGLLLTVIVYYIGFGAHATADRIYDPCRKRERPLGLSPDAIRLAIILGFLAAGLHLAYANRARLMQVRYLELFLIVGSLVAGRVYNALIRHATSATRGAARHAKAMVVLAAAATIAFVLLARTGLELPPPAMVALCAVVSFYFGSR